MVILQITTLDEFHECVVQAMFHFPALAALSIILASIVCIIIVAYKYKTKQIAKDEAVRYTGIIFGHCFFLLEHPLSTYQNIPYSGIMSGTT